MAGASVTLWTVTHQALCPWDFPGNTEVGCHLLLQGIPLTQRLNLSLLQWQADSLLLSHQGSPLMRHGHSLISSAFQIINVISIEGQK